MCQCCAEKKDIYLPQLATVADISQMNVTEKYLRLAMEDGQFDFIPGQFVEVSLAGIGEAPITISSSPTLADSFELVVRKVGRVSGAIHNLKRGDKVGHSRPARPRRLPGRGVPRARTWSSSAAASAWCPSGRSSTTCSTIAATTATVAILQGTKSYDLRLFTSEIEAWSKRGDVQMLETLDEGDPRWKGNVGVVTKLVAKVETDLKSAMILVCGPPIMYKFVLMALAEHEVPHQNIFLNLERKMKCGVGKCGHCQINNSYVCMSGPVFRYSDLASLPEAI